MSKARVRKRPQTVSGTGFPLKKPTLCLSIAGRGETILLSTGCWSRGMSLPGCSEKFSRDSVISCLRPPATSTSNRVSGRLVRRSFSGLETTSPRQYRCRGYPQRKCLCRPRTFGYHRATPKIGRPALKAAWKELFAASVGVR